MCACTVRLQALPYLCCLILNQFRSEINTIHTASTATHTRSPLALPCWLTKLKAKRNTFKFPHGYILIFSPKKYFQPLFLIFFYEYWRNFVNLPTIDYWTLNLPIIITFRNNGKYHKYTVAFTTCETLNKGEVLYV